MAVTWEAATVTAVTLSGGNLAATNTGTTSTSQGAHVAAADGKTTNKSYFECTVTTFTGGAGVGIGIGTTAATYAGISTTSTLGNMCYLVGHTGTGTIWGDGGNSGYNLGRALTTGDVICVAVDLINRRSWFRLGAAGNWNNTVGHDPTNGTGGAGGFVVPAGTIIPFVTFGSGLGGPVGVAGNIMTANFGASAFVGAMPSGYVAWEPPPTTANITQALAEHWLTTSPDARITQVVAEHWASVASGNLQAVVTQVLLEHWTSVAVVVPAAGGPMVTMIH